MFNKNDPLVGAVQEVMKRNQAERNAAKLVNEKFGVTDRKALPHERQGEWDAAYKSVLNEALHPNQQKLDVHEPEKDELTKKDFEMLRAKKKKMEESDVTSPSSMGIKKPDYATGTPDYANKGPQMVNRAAKTSLPPGTMKEEMTDAQMAKREKIVKSMKKKMAGFKDRYDERAKDVMYATATKQAMKEDNEGFNNRHGLSVTASAEKQVVAEVTMGGSAPAIAQRRIGASQRFRPRGAPTSTIQTSSKGPISQKPGINTATGSLEPTTNQRRSGYNITNVRDTAYGTNPTAKRLGPASSTGGSQSPIPISKTTSRFDDSGVRRPISGTNNLQTRLANMRKSAPALDTTRDKNLDQPATQSNMSRVMQAQDAAKRANMAGGGANVPKPTGPKVVNSNLAKPSGSTAQPYNMNIPKKLSSDGNVTPSVLPQTMQRGAEQDKVGVKRVEPVKSAPAPAVVPAKAPAPAPVRATPVAPVAKKETEFTRMMRRSQSKNDVAGTPGKRY